MLWEHRVQFSLWNHRFVGLIHIYIYIYRYIYKCIIYIFIYLYLIYICTKKFLLYTENPPKVLGLFRSRKARKSIILVRFDAEFQGDADEHG